MIRKPDFFQSLSSINCLFMSRRSKISLGPFKTFWNFLDFFNFFGFFWIFLDFFHFFLSFFIFLDFFLMTAVSLFAKSIRLWMVSTGKVKPLLLHNYTCAYHLQTNRCCERGS